MKIVNDDSIRAMLEIQYTLNTRVHPQFLDQNFPWLLANLKEANEAIDHMGWKWWKTQEPDIDQAKMELIDMLHFILSAYLQDAHLVTKEDALKLYPDETDAEHIASRRDLVIQSATDDISRLMDVLKGKKKKTSIADFISQWSLLKNIAIGKFITAPKRLEVDRNNIEEMQEASKELTQALLLYSIQSSVSGDNAGVLYSLTLLFNQFGMTWPDVYKTYIGKSVLNTFRQDHGYNDKPPTYKKMWWGREDNEYLTLILESLAVTDDLPDILIQDLRILYSLLPEKEIVVKEINDQMRIKALQKIHIVVGELDA